MFKNQLQELAQRSCFNLPAYASTREGPDHAPRFKACVNFNGEIFESPGFCPTLRQAEHAAAEVALNVLSTRGSKSLTARVLDETGVYKNLLQETAHKAGLNLPIYTTIRSGPGHVPVFTCTVELAGMTFTGESAKTKKQAEKNAAISAWSALKKMPSLVAKKEAENQKEDQERDQVIVTRFLSNFKGKQKEFHQRRPPRNNTRTWRQDFKHKVPVLQKQNSFVDLLPPPPPRTTSKILLLTSSRNKEGLDGNKFLEQGQSCHFRNWFLGPPNQSIYDPRRVPLSCGIMGNYNNNNVSYRGIAPAVQIRSVIPVCAAPPPAVEVKPLPLNPTTTTTLSLKEDPSSSSCSVSLPTKSSSDLSSELSKLELKGD